MKDVEQQDIVDGSGSRSSFRHKVSLYQFDVEQTSGFGFGQSGGQHFQFNINRKDRSVNYLSRRDCECSVTAPEFRARRRIRRLIRASSRWSAAQRSLATLLLKASHFPESSRRDLAYLIKVSNNTHRRFGLDTVWRLCGQMDPGSSFSSTDS